MLMLNEKIEQIKRWVIEQVIWAEKNLKDKSGAEKKAAVIKKLDDLIVLPTYLEWVDDIVISWLVDSVCEKLNAFAGHEFAQARITTEQEQKIANEINIQEAKKHGE